MADGYWLPNKWKLQEEFEEEARRLEELERQRKWEEISAYSGAPFRQPQEALSSLGMPFAAFEEWIAKPFAATVTTPFHGGELGEMEAYEVWQPRDILAGMPSWKQWGGWLGLGEKPEQYEMAQMGVKELVEFVPEVPIWMGLGGMGKTALQRLYKTADKGRAKILKGGAPTKAQEKAIGKVIQFEKQMNRAHPTVALEHPLVYSTTLTGPQQRKQVDIAAKELTEWLVGRKVVPEGAGRGVEVPPEIITTLSRKQGIVDKTMEKVAGFFERTYRVERSLESLDGYIHSGRFQMLGGKMVQTFYHPINNAKNQQLWRTMEVQDNFVKLMKNLKLHPDKLATEKKIIGDTEYLTVDRIGVYVNSLNPENKYHLMRGNKMTEESINAVVASLTPEEKALGDFFMRVANSRAEEVAKLYKYATGKELALVKNYWPIKVVGDDVVGTPFKQFVKNENALRYAMKYPSARIRKPFVKPRQPKAQGDINLNAYEVFWGHMQAVDHYITHEPVVLQLQRLLKSHALRRAIVQKSNKARLEVLEKWLAQVAETNPMYVKPLSIEYWGRMARVNAVTAVLGLNVVTAMKQFPSFFGGMAEVGEAQALRGLFTSLRHPKETMSLMKQFSPQIYKRQFEREIAAIQASKSVAKKMTGKRGWREWFMIFTTTLDRAAVNGLWRGGYDDALRKGLDPRTASEYATRIIRRTQPYFSIKDIPEYWRGGEFGKMLTIFTNQLNNYFNYYRFDILGRTMAKQISKPEALRRFVEAFVVPALMIGAITRSRPAQDVKEGIQDITSMGLATLPIFGNWLSAGVRGYMGGGLITTEVLEKGQRMFYNAMQENWDKVALLVPELAGYAAGIPVSQPKRFLKALVDLAQNKTDDLLELIWGEYTRRSARGKTGSGYKSGYGGGYGGGYR